MIYSRICEHGKLTISEGNPTNRCKACNFKVHGYQNGFAERKRFNKTLMREFNSYYESDKWGKKRGLACIGSEPLENIFSKPKEIDYTPILVEGIKKIRAGKANHDNRRRF